MGDEQKVEERLKNLMKNKDDLRRVVRRDLRSVEQGKRAKQFFDQLYGLNYTEEQLAEKPFLNVGPGSFHHKYWTTVDKFYGGDVSWSMNRRGVEQKPVDYQWDFYERSPLPFEDNSIRLVYCSHVIEHGFNNDVEFLFSELYRVLKPGGVLRVVCPDAALLADAYYMSDWPYFMHYLSVKTNRRRPDVSDFQRLEESGFFAEFVLEWVSLLAHSKNPFVVKRDDAKEFLARFETLRDGFNAAQALSSRELNRRVGGHVNWFDEEKLFRFLKRAGFQNLVRSRYLQSQSPLMRDAQLFDRTDPEMSLFVEAVKAS